MEIKGLILVTTDKELFVEPEEYEKLQDTFVSFVFDGFKMKLQDIFE
jgi:hypothetical protein